MSRDDMNAGVMDASYAQGRRQRPHLRFRLEVRALLAVQTFQKRHGSGGDAKVLELGAAEGQTLLRIRELLDGRGEFHGVELAEDLIAEAPPLPDNVKLLRGNVMELPEELEEGTYDLVTVLAVLEHLPDPLAALREAYRMLRPGGVLVATCPHPMWDDIAGKLNMVEEEVHEQELGKREMVQMARDAGFSEVAFEPFMFAPVGTLPYLGVQVPAELSLRLDGLIRKVPFSGLSFVNQALTGYKP